MNSGTITIRRPRVRGMEERFESRVLPLFARRTKELGALLWCQPVVKAPPDVSPKFAGLLQCLGRRQRDQATISG